MGSFIFLDKDLTEEHRQAIAAEIADYYGCTHEFPQPRAELVRVSFTGCVDFLDFEQRELSLPREILFLDSVLVVSLLEPLSLLPPQVVSKPRDLPRPPRRLGPKVIKGGGRPGGPINRRGVWAR